MIAAFGGEVRLEERSVPEPHPGEVLVKVHGCGVGLTLERARIGALGGSVPRIVGHELSGVIAECGAGVDRWHEGDAVTTSFYLVCGHCRWCLAGRETLCLNFAGYVGTHADGGLAEYCLLPERNLVAVPDGVDTLTAGVVADALATPYHIAAARARILPGQTVAVIGAGGGVGIHMVEMARAFGGRVVAVERDPAKLARLRELELEVFDTGSAHSWSGELKAAAGTPLDTVIDFVATPDTLSNGLHALGRGGNLVIVGLEPGARFDLDPAHVLLNEIVVTGSRYASRREIGATLELVGSGQVRPVIGARFPLREVAKAFQTVRGNDAFGRILVEVAA